MATVVKLKIDDFRGRGLDLLGQRFNVPSPGNPGIVFPIFTTGDIAFRSGGGRIYIAWIVIQVSDGLPLPLNSTWAFGSWAVGAAGNTVNDWNVLSLNQTPWDVAANLPIVIGPYPFGQNQGFVANTPVYAPGTTFVAVNVLGAGGNQTLDISCYGWAAN